MKRWLGFLLLVSLGANIGLAMRLAGRPAGESRRPGPERVATETGRERPGLGRAIADSAVWHKQVERRLNRLLSHLDLDDATSRSFAAVHRANARRVWRDARDLAQRRENLREVLLAEDRSPATIRRSVAEMNAAQARFDSAVAEALLSELDALPVEQQGRYLELLPWQRWGNHPPGGGGPHRGRHSDHAPPDR